MKLQSILIFCLLAAAGFAQQAPAPMEPAAHPAEKAPRAEPEVAVYVRRFSAGAIFSFQVSPSIPSSIVEQTVATNVNVNWKTEAEKRIFGGGLVVQVALTNRFALAANLLMRRSSFRTTDMTYLGVDDSTTADDDRIKTTIEATTRAELTDIPILLRYYKKDRTTPGGRMFYEGGVALRSVHGIHTFGQTTNNDGTETCCDDTPLGPANKLLTGFVVGAGYQAIDDMKFRVIPEIRYTRWMGRTFDIRSTVSGVNQLEACISITF